MSSHEEFEPWIVHFQEIPECYNLDISILHKDPNDTASSSCVIKFIGREERGAHPVVNVGMADGPNRTIVDFCNVAVVFKIQNPVDHHQEVRIMLVCSEPLELLRQAIKPVGIDHHL